MSPYLYSYLLFELAAVTFGDVKYRKISNAWALFNIVAFIALTFIYPAQYFYSLSTFSYPLATIILGFLFFWLKIMGGGDSKFLATFFYSFQEKGMGSFL